MCYQLVLQFRGDSLADYDQMVALEDRLIEDLFLGLIILSPLLGCALCVALACAMRAKEAVHNNRPLHTWIGDIAEIELRITTTNGVTLRETNVALVCDHPAGLYSEKPSVCQ